ncbi:MAG: RCC1 repeat-containing protein [bacterium]|nr:RCC1 repeat-containing protein [bacterium]
MPVNLNLMQQAALQGPSAGQSGVASLLRPFLILILALTLLSEIAEIAHAEPTTTSLASSPNPSSPGETVTFEATVKGFGVVAPTGTVSFTKDGSELGTAPLVAIGVTATAIAAGSSHTCALTSDGGVMCWGSNSHGQLGNGTTRTFWPVNVIGLGNGVTATAIAAGASHTCALTSAGEVMCWGSNSHSQLGDDTTVDRSTPVNVSGFESRVTAIAAGRLHTCALTSTGRVKCWGWNTVGQLGDDTTIDRSTPVNVSGFESSRVTAIAAGAWHSCALTSAGGVKCWGWNGSGPGRWGPALYSSTPIDVEGLGSGVTAIAAGSWHNCALTSTGGVKCWGLNDLGELGNETPNFRPALVPVDVIGLGIGVTATAISTGDFFTCALTSTGGVKCWGNNLSGQIGNGTTSLDPGPVPVNVIGLGNGVTATAIAAGDSHTCALTSDGGVKCWGSNRYGQFGNGSGTNSSTPVDVIGLATDITAIAVGGSHTCALTRHGGLKCWGSNTHGQLGNGTRTNSSIPVEVIRLPSPVKAIAAGQSHSCALTREGAVMCWGGNDNGQLGNGRTFQSSIPSAVNGLAGEVISDIAAGSFHTCALKNDGEVMCWGANGHGQLGTGRPWPRPTPGPVAVQDLGFEAAKIAAGVLHTCALSNTGEVACWGRNGRGQLGNGTTADSAMPVPVDLSRIRSEITAITLGGAHSCALTQDGEVMCWGWNHNGQLGNRSTMDSSVPVRVAGFGAEGAAVAVSAGSAHNCALTESGTLKCWGQNREGQLGDGNTSFGATSAPVDVRDIRSRIIAIAAGGHTCVLTLSQGVKCWGRNHAGQLGYGSSTGSSRPVNVIGLPSSTAATAIAAGAGLTCALTDIGGVRCWGLNHAGQLGNASTVGSSRPVDVHGLRRQVSAIAIGSGAVLGFVRLEHACALTIDGEVVCWGSNRLGQLGNGTRTDSATPSGVVEIETEIIAITAGGSHTCALTVNGAIKCWGENHHGQLGNLTTTNSSTPEDVIGLGGDAVAIAAGVFHTCALMSDGQIMCWGYNNRGQLGNGRFQSGPTPVPSPVLESDIEYISITAGLLHTCALTRNGPRRCWGLNNQGQLGDETTIDRNEPFEVRGLGIGVTATAIAAGGTHTCAVTSTGGVKCWGWNTVGQLGDGTTSLDPGPVPVDVIGLGNGVTATAIAAGYSHTCALTSDGEVMCWGRNARGQLGNGSTTNSSTPVPVDWTISEDIFAVAAFRTMSLEADDHEISATYSGDVNFGRSISRPTHRHTVR